MQLEYVREIKGLFSYPRVGTEEKWIIARCGPKYAFIWNMPDEDLTMENRTSRNSGIKWFDTRLEAESAFLDKLEQQSYYYPTEELCCDCC